MLWPLVLLFSFFPFVMFLSGCGISATTKAGAISVTYPSGVTAAQFPVLSTAAVTMVPLNEKVNAGVDWTLTCGGSPLAPPVPGGTSVGCGTVLPFHTASGVPATYTAPSLIPVGTTVTITATVTSDPSQSSAVALTIANLPVVVSIPSVPTSMAVSATARLSASLTNDTNEAGAKWTVSCGSSDCGSFNPVQTAGGAQHGPGEESGWRYRGWRHRHDHGNLCCQFGRHGQRHDIDSAYCSERVSGNLYRGCIWNGAIHGDCHKRCQELGRGVELQSWYMWELQSRDHCQRNSNNLYGAGHCASRWCGDHHRHLGN
jgi:hypothetical protein